jgi:hypothetical protein
MKVKEIRYEPELREANVFNTGMVFILEDGTRLEECSSDTIQAYAVVPNTTEQER